MRKLAKNKDGIKYREFIVILPNKIPFIRRHCRIWSRIFDSLIFTFIVMSIDDFLERGWCRDISFFSLASSNYYTLLFDYSFGWQIRWCFRFAKISPLSFPFHWLLATSLNDASATINSQHCITAASPCPAASFACFITAAFPADMIYILDISSLDALSRYQIQKAFTGFGFEVTDIYCQNKCRIMPFSIWV